MTARLFLFLLLFLLNRLSNAQIPVPDIEKLVEHENFKEADNLVNERINSLLHNGNPDTISRYINYLGVTATALRSAEKARRELLAVIEKAKEKFPFSSELPYVYFAAADFFSRQGNNALSYELLRQLLQYFKGKENIIRKHLCKIESNSGTYSMRMGNYALASGHYRESLRQFQSDDLTELFIINNSMGIVMWQASKLDSCLFYFNKAIEVLQKTDSSPLNRYQRVAMMQGNISNVYWELGETEESIKNAEQSILNYKLYSIHADSKAEKEKGLKGDFISSYNLGISYQNLGNFSKALELLNYTYEERLKHLGAQNPDVYKSLLTIATVYYDQKDLFKALNYLRKALDFWNTQQASIWQAQANAYLAYTYEELKDVDEASAYYETANKIYSSLFRKEYNLEYLTFLTKASGFYAANRQPEKAAATARKSVQYVIDNQGEYSLIAAYQLASMADVCFKSGNYQQTISNANRALAVMDHLINKSNRFLDSISIEMKRPMALLLKTKAQYELNAQTPQAILQYLEELRPAVALLDRQKTIFADEKDINSLIANNKELLDFINQLQLRLYNLTNDHSYLDKIINLHESAIYNRIRSRLDRQKTIQFARIPAEILRKEEVLKKNIAESFITDRVGSVSGQGYLSGIHQWNEFLNTLKTNYPQYYQVRYASLSNAKLEVLGAAVPSGITVVRYIYIGDSLFALVADKSKQQWVPLSAENLDMLITDLSMPGNDMLRTGEIAFQIYRQIWEPLETLIRNKRVTIIPDSILYYLSFDMLTVQKTKSYKELVRYSLLSRYTVSYHYSLFALSGQAKEKTRMRGIAAFVPGFSDDIKENYKTSLKKDSLLADESYLSLLPLPFSIDLAKKAKNRFGGDLFIGEKSTQEAFKEKAARHFIIHLGTHAEANNQYPEFSRLIFARNPSDINADNSLYLYDIYNCDLTSELSVLTACETGRPGFYPGEGMISMAHAFSYAGSSCILTGLWKIDEQASTIITGYFYKNLQRGMPKDEALQQAKLKYLEHAEGRMLAPQYWAGLVIMGDISPVLLKEESAGMIAWIAGSLLSVIVTAIILFRRHNKKSNTSPGSEFQ